MSDIKNKFTFDGNLYEKNSDGSLEKVLTTDSVTNSGIVEVSKSEDGKSIQIDSVGLSIEGGLLCANFYEDEEV